MAAIHVLREGAVVGSPRVLLKLPDQVVDSPGPLHLCPRNRPGWSPATGIIGGLSRESTSNSAAPPNPTAGHAKHRHPCIHRRYRRTTCSLPLYRVEPTAGHPRNGKGASCPGEHPCSVFIGHHHRNDWLVLVTETPNHLSGPAYSSVFAPRSPASLAPPRCPRGCHTAARSEPRA
jgi:hypothetical protein